MLGDNPMSKSDIIHSTILALLPPPSGRARSAFRNGGIDASTRLLEIGLIDSTRLLDIILEVEARCGVEFNPAHIDFDKSLTFGNLISAFDPPNG
jgi:acyl carrier protein